MGTPSYEFFAELTKVIEIPPKGILSRTLQNDDRSKVILFGFAAGEELSAHTAPMPATLHFLQGEAEVRLGEDIHQAGVGSYAYMPAGLPHGIKARTALLMLLTMIKNAQQSKD